MDPLTLGRAWNSFACINEIPEELLVQVFLFACTQDQDQDQDGPRELKWLMLVCRRWRYVIVSHACFWNMIFVRGRSKWFRLTLRRSKLAMLHLYIDPHTLELASMLPDVIPHRDRIRSLVQQACVSYVQFMALSSLLEAPFRSLTRLRVGPASPDGRPDTGYFVLIPEHYPQLTELVLIGVHVQWTVPLLSQLEKLYLTKCSIWPSHMDGDTFLDVLQHGQHLNCLDLQDFIGAACSVVPSRDRPPFTLPCLDVVRVVDEDRWVQQFMAFVHAPRPHGSAHARYFGIGDLDNASTPLSHHEVFPAPDVPLFPDTGFRLYVHAFKTEVRCTRWYHGSDGTRYNSYSSLRRGQELVDDIDDLIRLLGNTMVHPSALCMLDLKIPMHNVDCHTLAAFLDAAPHLQWLHLGCGHDFRRPLPSGIFEILATRTGDYDTNEDTAAVRCPKLKYLGLGGLDWDGGAVMDAALGCLRTRARVRPSVQQLEYLTIRIKSLRIIEEEELGEWFKPTEVWYGTLLQAMVSPGEFSFALGPNSCGLY